jgi:hypothetical protein
MLYRSSNQLSKATKNQRLHAADQRVTISFPVPRKTLKNPAQEGSLVWRRPLGVWDKEHTTYDESVKKPGWGAGTHTAHTDHTDEPHNQPDPPTHTQDHAMTPGTDRTRGGWFHPLCTGLFRWRSVPAATRKFSQHAERWCKQSFDDCKQIPRQCKQTLHHFKFKHALHHLSLLGLRSALLQHRQSKLRAHQHRHERLHRPLVLLPRNWSKHFHAPR